MFEGYIEGSCAKDEKVKVIAEYHWVVWLKFYAAFLTLGLAAIFCCIMAWQMYQDNDADVAMGTLLFGVLLAIYPFYLFLELKLTEMACTTRRVIFKTGIVSIKTSEIKIDKIESIQIEQTFWGRIFGYGNICFSGTGTAKVEFFNVDNPWQIKPRIEEAIDESLKGNSGSNSDD